MRLGIAGPPPSFNSASREVVMPKSSKMQQSLRLLTFVSIAAGGLIAAGPVAVAAPQELKMVEHATTDAVTDTGAAGDSAGNILTFSNEVFDADDKNKIGTDQGICFRTVPGKAWECFWTLSLEKGQLTVEGPFYDSGESVLAITGGTGDFAGALGEMALSAIGTDGKAYNFTYRIK
jgi:allene oxide cyclase